MSEYNFNAFVERIEEAYNVKIGQNNWLDVYESDIMNYFAEQLADTDAASVYEFRSQLQLPLELSIKEYLMYFHRSRRTSEVMAANELLVEVINYYTNKEDFDIAQTVQKYKKLGPLLTKYFISVFTNVTEELRQRESVLTGLQVLRMIERIGSITMVSFSANDLKWYKNPQNIAVS